MLPTPLFEIFNSKVYMYGFCIATGLICCLIAFYILTSKKGMPAKVQDYIFFVLIGGLASGFFFAMFFQAVYNWIDGKPFNLFGAGLTVMGGLIGGASMFLLLYFLIGKFYFKGKDKGLHIKHFNTLIRVAPICICIAHGFGRIGCLMSGCCHGQYLGQEYVFGGIWMRGTINKIKTWGYFVPTQLYEALFLFALATVLIILLFKRSNVNMSIYLISYGVWRFIIEYFRADERGELMPGLTPSQWQSILFILGGALLIIIFIVKKWPLFFSKENRQELLVCESKSTMCHKKAQTVDDFSDELKDMVVDIEIEDNSNKQNDKRE